MNIDNVQNTLKEFKKDIEKMTIKTPHSLPLLAQSIYNTPLLTTTNNLDSILSVINSHEFNTSDSGFIAKESPFKQRVEAETSGVGVIDVVGSLTSKPSEINALCGLKAYSDITKELETHAKNGVKTVVLNVESGGGSAAKCFSSANSMRDIANANGIKLITWVDGIAASAAYALAVISDEIFAESSTSTIGSIGVVTALRSTSADFVKSKTGTTTTYLTGGANKIPFANDGSFKPEFISSLQNDIDHLYSEFVAHVNKHRPVLSVEAIKNTEASTYRADIALQKNLVDKVMLEDEFLAMLKSGNAATTTTAPTANTANTGKRIQDFLNTPSATSQAQAQSAPVEPQLTAQQLQNKRLKEFVERTKQKPTFSDITKSIANEREQEIEIEAETDEQRNARLSNFLKTNKK